MADTETPKAQPNPKVIAECKRLLAFAEKGDITELAFMGYGKDIFTVGYHYSKPSEIPHIAGEAGALVASMHYDMMSGRQAQPQPKRPLLGV